MAFIRTFIFFVGYWFLTIIYGTGSAFTWLLPPLIRHKVVSSWTTAIVIWLRIACGVRYKVIGLDNLPVRGEKPVVALAKHQSAWETLYLQSLLWPATTVLKRELLNIPFFGWGLRALNPIPIDRSNPRVALKQVKTIGAERIEQGYNVILFPEGTRMKVGEKGTYARSGADIAVTANANVIPIAHNAGHCWPPGKFTKYAGLITVSIGHPISTEGKNTKQVMAEVEEWIEGEMGRI